MNIHRLLTDRKRIPASARLELTLVKARIQGSIANLVQILHIKVYVRGQNIGLLLHAKKKCCHSCNPKQQMLTRHLTPA